MVKESNIYGFENNIDLDEKIKTIVTKEEIKAEQDKIVKLKTDD